MDPRKLAISASNFWFFLKSSFEYWLRASLWPNWTLCNCHHCQLAKIAKLETTIKAPDTPKVVNCRLRFSFRTLTWIKSRSSCAISPARLRNHSAATFNGTPRNSAPESWLLFFHSPRATFSRSCQVRKSRSALIHSRSVPHSRISASCTTSTVSSGSCRPVTTKRAGYPAK